MADARGYGRRSDDDQSTFSPAAQQRAVEAWCQANGHTLVAWYFDDDLSGKKEDRDNFQLLLNDACAHPGSLVIVHKIDRLARDTEVILNRHKRLRKARVRLCSVSEPIDFDTPFGTVVLTQIASLGQFHVDNLAPEVIKGLHEKYEQGGHNGHTPFGYARIHQFNAKGERIKGTERIVQTDDAPAVRLMFQLYATGCYSDGTLRDEVHGRGLTLLNPKTGQRVPFQRDSIGNILTNRFYLGEVAYKGQWRPGNHDAMIDRDVWDAVQTIRTRRTVYRGGRYAKPNTTGLLSETGYCGACGARLYYHINTSNQFAYYTCSARRKFGREACDSRALHATRHEELVVTLLRAIALPPDIIEQVMDEAERITAAPAQPATSVDRGQLTRQLERLRAAYFSGDDAISEQQYKSETARIKALLADTPTLPTRCLNTAKALAMLQTLGTVLDAGSAAERRAVVMQLFDQVWLERQTITAIRPSGTYGALVQMAAKVHRLTSTGLEPVTFSSGG